MTLLSMKIAKNKDFIKNPFGNLSIDRSNFQSKVINAKKFIVGQELFKLDGTWNDARDVVFGTHNEKELNQFATPAKKQRLYDTWSEFARLPFKSIFIENATGGILVEEFPEYKICTLIYDNGGIMPYDFYINNTLEVDQPTFGLLIKKELTEAMATEQAKLPHDKANDPYYSPYTEMHLVCSFTSMMVLNILTHINAVNTNITQYKPSNKERKGCVSNVFKESFVYNIVNIFTNKSPTFTSLKQVEDLSAMKTTSRARAHMVRGHFKKRSTGLYWWNPFLRCKHNPGYVEKIYLLVDENIRI